ncbi:MAG: NADH-quinone oxidoreductase subunit N [bacterium]|jgi:NADH-quinone oxidoreductase subunit N|nr:NADH-quinone oxidoreductase subunit N [bacterium]
MDLSGLNVASLLPEMIVAGGGLLVLGFHALWQGRRDGWLGGIALVAVLAALAACLWPATREAGYFGTALSDSLAFAGRITVLASLLLLLPGGASYLRERDLPRAETHALALFAACGMMALASAGDLIIVFLAVEVLSLSLYALAGLLGERRPSREAALTYFLAGSFASGFLLFGMALLAGAAGTTSLGGLAAGLARQAGTGGEWIALGGTVLMLTGFLFKVGAVPFHSWVAEVYTGSPTWVTAFMSTGAKAAAFAGFGRVVLPLAGLGDGWVIVLGICAALTMVLGNFTALVQLNAKRMLAFSSVAHAGYLLLGLMATRQAGENLEAVLFYLLPYVLVNAALFLIAAKVSAAGGGAYHLDDYKGLARRSPLLAGLLTVLLLGLAGIPPLAGFLGKFYVFSAAVRAGHTGLAVLGVLTSVVAVYTYLRPVVYAWFHEPERSEPLTRDAGLLGAGLLASLGLVVLGVWPRLWLDLTRGIGL